MTYPSQIVLAVSIAAALSFALSLAAHRLARSMSRATQPQDQAASCPSCAVGGQAWHEHAELGCVADLLGLDAGIDDIPFSVEALRDRAADLEAENTKLRRALDQATNGRWEVTDREAG